jgi:hypothetical protein
MIATRAAAAAAGGAMEVDGSASAVVNASGDASAMEADTRVPSLTPAQARRVCASVREACASLRAGGDALSVHDGVAAVTSLAAAACDLAASLPPGFLDPLLPRGTLNEEQMAQLRELNGLLCGEYRMRREMLIHRVDCTLAALMTSPRTAAPARRAEALRAVAPERDAMSAEPGVWCVPFAHACA